MINGQKLKNSFRYAGRGLAELWHHQQSFRIELLAAALIIWATYVFHLRSIERGLIVLMVLLVLAAEIMNSVFEYILDGISKAPNERFRVAKDAMAGMTLLMAIGAAVVAVIIFYPYVRFLLVG